MPTLADDIAALEARGITDERGVAKTRYTVTSGKDLPGTWLRVFDGADKLVLHGRYVRTTGPREENDRLSLRDDLRLLQAPPKDDLLRFQVDYRVTSPNRTPLNISDRTARVAIDPDDTTGGLDVTLRMILAVKEFSSNDAALQSLIEIQRIAPVR